MGTAIDPFTFPQDWDHVVVQGVSSPGRCVVGGAAVAGRWDVKSGSGDGATITYKGREVQEGITLTFTIWDQAGWANWLAFETLLQFDPLKGEGKAIDIAHPRLEAVGIRSCVVKKIDAPEWIPEKQLATIVVYCIEYRPPAATNPTKTPNGSKTNTSKKSPTALSEKEKEIARLTEQARGLPSLLP